MSEDQAQYAVQKKQPLDIDISQGVLPKNYSELLQFAKLYQESGLAPKSFQSVPQVAVAIGMCLELGRPILTGLQDMAVINGKVAIYGDAALAQVRSSGQLEYIKETEEGKPYTDEWTFRCEIKRKGSPDARVGIWTWEDAKRAGFDKPKTKDNRDDIWSPWTRFTRRMMQFKARNFVMRDEFGDILKGLPTAEDAHDIIDVTPEPAPGPQQIPPQGMQPTQNLPPTTEGRPAYDFKTNGSKGDPQGTSGPAEDPKAGPEKNEAILGAEVVLKAIRDARPGASGSARGRFINIYENNRDLILSLEGNELNYVKTKWENAGLDWDRDFMKCVPESEPEPPNQAQDTTSPGEGDQQPPWEGENVEPDPAPEPEPPTITPRPEPKTMEEYQAYAKAHKKWIYDQIEGSELDLLLDIQSYEAFLRDWLVEHPQFDDMDAVLVTKWRHGKEQQFFNEYKDWMRSLSTRQ